MIPEETLKEMLTSAWNSGQQAKDKSTYLSVSSLIETYERNESLQQFNLDLSVKTKC